jgi:hypothetical protein
MKTVHKRSNVRTSKFKVHKNRSILPTLVPEVYFYYFPSEGERKNKPLEPGYILPRIVLLDAFHNADNVMKPMQIHWSCKLLTIFHPGLKYPELKPRTDEKMFTDEDPGLRIESFAVINLRDVSTNI